MINPGQILRMIHINRVLVRHGLDEIVFATHLFRPIRFLFVLLPWNWFRKEQGPRGERIRKTLEELGPIFVKFGQMLSTRRDLLPSDIADELTKLQDRVPAFSGVKAREMVEKAYGESVQDVFLWFDEAPLASASIAQVHPARLKNNSEVIVKIIRPDIEKTIKRDIALLYTFADLAQRYWSEGKRLRPREIVEEYQKTIFDELDLMREAASASQLRRNFLNSPILYIPEIYWPLTRSNVMVMERINGIPVGDIKQLKAHNIDLAKLSEKGVEIFFTQVFRDNFFHADMHPGNIFVSPEGQYIAVDFGIVGTLQPDDKRYLAENFLAFFNRDYRRVAELHVESGWVPSKTRIDEFESAIRTVCEPIFERPLKDISFGQLLLRLFQTARRFQMVVQPQLVLLQKTLLNIEGLGRQLNPELDLWRTAKPFLESWMSEQVGPKALLYSLKDKAPYWIEKFPELPSLIIDTLDVTKKHRLMQARQSEEVQQHQLDFQNMGKRICGVLIGASLLICSILVLVFSDPSYVMLAGTPVLSWVFGLAALMLFILTWSAERKN